MQFIIVLLSFVATALAQGISIAAPSVGRNITAGQQTTVSVMKPDTLTGSTEIGVSIALHHCSQNPCEDASEDLGEILYAGSFNPQRPSDSAGQPAQNFTVTIPAGFPTGPAVISVPHANLVGAGPYLSTQIANVTVVIS